MSELSELLRELADDDGASRGDTAIFEHATVVAASTRRRRRAVRVGGSVTIAVVAVAVVAIVLTTAHSADNVHVAVRQPPATTVSTVPVADVRAGHWELIPPAPLPPGGESVWTGDRLIVWGGAAGKNLAASAAGAMYNPTTGEWRSLPPAPIRPRTDFAIAWTGSEMLVWGGYKNGYTQQATGDGAAYSPLTNTWRVLPPSPMHAQASAVAVRAGKRVVFFSSVDGQVVAYDSSANRWTSITPPNIGGKGQWYTAASSDDGATIVAGYHWLGGDGCSPQPMGGCGSGSALFVFDASRNTWRPTAPTGDAIRNVYEAVWVGRRVLLRGDRIACWACSHPPVDAVSAFFDPATGVWTPLAGDPLTPVGVGSANVSTAWTGNALWSFNGGTEARGGGVDIEPGDASLYDPATRAWTRLARGPGGCGDYEQPPVWTGREVLVYCQAVRHTAGSSLQPLNAAGYAWVPRGPQAVATDPRARADTAWVAAR